MAESTVVYTPDSNNGGTIPAWMAMNNGNLFGNGGWGGGILGFLLGLFFGNGWGGFGGFGNGFGGGAGAEFIDTLVHEIFHLAVAVALKEGANLKGEVPAYIAGDSARDLSDSICRLGCVPMSFQ